MPPTPPTGQRVWCGTVNDEAPNRYGARRSTEQRPQRRARCIQPGWRPSTTVWHGRHCVRDVSYWCVLLAASRVPRRSQIWVLTVPTNTAYLRRQYRVLHSGRPEASTGMTIRRLRVPTDKYHRQTSQPLRCITLGNLASIRARFSTPVWVAARGRVQRRLELPSPFAPLTVRRYRTAVVEVASEK